MSRAAQGEHLKQASMGNAAVPIAANPRYAKGLTFLASGPQNS
jgi:hypothetical protein